jgi:hypothetical protein
VITGVRAKVRDFELNDVMTQRHKWLIHGKGS